MRKRLLVAGAIALFGVSGVAYAAGGFNVKPGEFEPHKTPLVNAAWLNGIGCPTGAKTAEYIPPDFTDTRPGPAYTDPACPTGDAKDRTVEGLLLAKTGPTSNAAAAGAHISGFKGTLTELGWDIRKPNNTGDDRGSHCGAGAPRWNVQTTDGDFYFIGCNSPAPTTQTDGAGFVRERWGNGTAGSVMGFNATEGFAFEPITGEVNFIEIVFDEGQDTGPDNFGLAVLDNIDINGTLIGRGPTNPN